MEANKNKPTMDFGVIPTNKKSSVKSGKQSKMVKKEKVTKPRKQKVVKIEVEGGKPGRKRHVPEDWIKIGVKVSPETYDDLKIALVHFRNEHASQDLFVNAALNHYIKFLGKRK